MHFIGRRFSSPTQAHDLKVYYLISTNQEDKHMMTKQALLENVLDMWLTQKQIETIKTGWKAFYENPMQYKNSVVIDMVKQFLKEVA